jgi:hypothetical protein
LGNSGETVRRLSQLRLRLHGVTPGEPRRRPEIMRGLGRVDRSEVGVDVGASMNSDGSKPRFSTPMTTYGSRSSWIVLPMIAGSDPRRRVHQPYGSRGARAVREILVSREGAPRRVFAPQSRKNPR